MGSQYRIGFDSIAWENVAPGARQKSIVCAGQRLRLVEFNDTFLEPDWCCQGHAGYLLAGRLLIDFSGTIQEFKQGDGLLINAGSENKHKASVRRGERALLILFEGV